VEIAGGTGRRIVDLSRNLALPESLPNDLARRVRDAISAVELHDYLGRDPAGGSTLARLAGARWMENFASGPDVCNTCDTDFRETLVLGGGQLALNAIICALTKLGDSILVDALTFPGFRLAAQLHHVHLVPLAGHSNRTEPEVLATAMRKHKAKLWFCMPTLHNPTASVMSARLRSKIAEVANASGLVVVEDDVYGFLNPGVSSLAEQCSQGIRLVSMAKSTLAGLRVAYLRTNQHLAARIRSSIEALCWMATPASSSLTTSLIANGTAKALADWKRGELTTRLALARSLLARRLSCGASASLHAWLSLPDRWNTSSFAAACWDRGVQVSPSDEFVATPRNHQSQRGANLVGHNSNSRGIGTEFGDRGRRAALGKTRG
jgi:DNA-binding transcriptional MocR family regulator